jgi:hypothetical protein
MKALAALTWGRKPIVRDEPVSVVLEPQCELLFELFSGRLGVVSLGRMLSGRDAGRLVALRALPAAPASELTSAVEVSRRLAHPKLAKAVGIVRLGASSYVASEYIPGVTLFELGRAVRGRESAPKIAVAVRIILDALRAAQAATQLLTDQSDLQSLRCLYPESIWIAEFGEVFLAEFLVAQRLAQPAAIAERVAPPSSLRGAFDQDAASADIAVAAVELGRLASGRAASGAPSATDLACLPDELRALLVKALRHGGGPGYASLPDFIAALSNLDPSLIATEQQVSRELRRLLGPTLDLRRQRLDLREQGSLSLGSEEEDATKCFHVAAPTRVAPAPHTVGAEDEDATKCFRAAAPARVAPAPHTVGAERDEDATKCFHVAAPTPVVPAPQTLGPEDEDATQCFHVVAPARVAQAAARQEPSDDVTKVSQRGSPCLDDSDSDAEFGLASGNSRGDTAPLRVSGWGVTRAFAEATDAQTSPNLDPLLLDSLGRTTSPNLFGTLAASPALSPAEEPCRTAATEPSRKVGSRRPRVLKLVLLLAVGLAAGALLRSVWLTGHMPLALKRAQLPSKAQRDVLRRTGVRRPDTANRSGHGSVDWRDHSPRSSSRLG